MIVQFLNDTGGSVITSLAVESGQTITSKGINTTRVKAAGLFVVHNGTVNAITRQVSPDDVTYYTPWDKGASLTTCITASANNSRFIVIEPLNANSGNVISPFTRYNVTMLSGGTLSLIYIADETPQV